MNADIEQSTRSKTPDYTRALTNALASFSRARLLAGPTPTEHLENLSQAHGQTIYLKRDDASTLAFGGNKLRQLEFYLGEALAQGADTVLITGAVQSNFVRLAAAAAGKLKLKCHVQLEERVANKEDDLAYCTSGNVLLNKLFGATIHHYPEGEDEAGADRQLHAIADELKASGQKPYVIPLAPGHPPLGALGYVACAIELTQEWHTLNINPDEIFVASGSGHTHGGLLFGLRALGSKVKVTGMCVRRSASEQHERIYNRCDEVAQLLKIHNPVTKEDVVVDDAMFAPGYGKFNERVFKAIQQTAGQEGTILDPVYTGKCMAGLLARAGELRSQSDSPSTLMMIHTGGTPALFAYITEVQQAFDAY